VFCWEVRLPEASVSNQARRTAAALPAEALGATYTTLGGPLRASLSGGSATIWLGGCGQGAKGADVMGLLGPR
jgi:hypothetical protein